MKIKLKLKKFVMFNKLLSNLLLIYKLCKIVNILFILLNINPTTYINYIIEEGIQSIELTEQQKETMKLRCLIIATGALAFCYLYDISNIDFDVQKPL